MRQKNNAGFSLIEVVVAIAILAIVVIPVCSSMVLSARMNAKAEATLQARVAVSSAVEILMAEGVSAESANYAEDRFPNVTVQTVLNSETSTSYLVTVFDGSNQEESLVTVTTQIRAVETSPNGEGAADEET